MLVESKDALENLVIKVQEDIITNLVDKQKPCDCDENKEDQK